jgi:hypothetical protein
MGYQGVSVRRRHVGKLKVPLLSAFHTLVV